MNSNGSNLNAGSTCSDVGGGSNSAVYTSTGGNFDGVSLFTPVDGQTTSSLVNVGDYVALYNTGDTACRCVAQVTVVGAGVNGAITVSTTIKYGTVPTSNSGSRACKAGGAWASLAICAASTPLNTGTVPQSTRVNVKAGTYANTTTTRAIGIVGTALLKFWIRGYLTTPGDQDANLAAVAGTDIPSLTFTGATSRLTTGAHTVLTSIDVTSADTSANGTLNISATTVLENVRTTNTAANVNGIALITNGNAQLSGCYFKATTTASKVIAGASVHMIGCTVVGGIIGIATPNGLIAFCIFDSQAGDAITHNATGPTAIINCGFYAPLGNGINITTLPTNGLSIANNYFSTVNQASKSAINNTSGANSDNMICVGNAYFNCTATITGITETFALFDNGTLASEAFKAPASQDFTMLPVGWNIGFPGKFCNTSVFRGYLDVGAVQSIVASGGAYRPQQRPSGV